MAATRTPQRGAASADQALSVAEAFLDAWTRQDFETAAQYLADGLVFDGPIAHYRSAQEFLAGSRPFAARLRPGWSSIAAFGDEKQALLLYDLVLVSGDTMRVADHYTVRDGKIQTEQILWDTGSRRQG
jgi:SnoaL-like domain